jgi:hypothetical protein
MSESKTTKSNDQKLYDDGFNDALELAAKIARKFPKANRQDLFEDVEKSILALKVMQ